MVPPPLPPKTSGTSGSSVGNGRLHLRRRSQPPTPSVDATEFESLIIDRNGQRRFSGSHGSADDTVVDFEEDEDDADHHQLDRERHKNGYNGDAIKPNRTHRAANGGAQDDASSPLLPVGSGPGYLVWQDKKLDRTRRSNARCLLIFFLLISAFGGWIVGVVAPPRTFEDVQRNGGGFTGPGVFDLMSGQDHASAYCNPYEQHGILNTSGVSFENVWLPLVAPESCKPVDYVNLLRQAVLTGKTPEEVRFAQNRTIVIYGDSVDRDHNEHFCTLVGGNHEMIGVNHTMSPPYPEGEELPPEGYKHFETGKREWPDYDQSRPFVCHVGLTGLRILNVFHYGYRGRTQMIENHPHFYPPATIEDRFDQILVPIVNSLAKEHNVSSTPAILSITSGFWGLLRQAVEDDANLVKAVNKGSTVEEAKTLYDTWLPMTPARRDWIRLRTTQILRHVGRGWALAEPKPKILWRALHHIKEQHNLPHNHVQALDQIGRSVVEQLIAEGRAAETGAQRWKNWIQKIKETLGRGGVKVGEGKTISSEEQREALQMGFGHRLKVDEWGTLMRGQERYFRDNIHPLMLPGSYLYGNMLMQQLKMTVDLE